MRILHVLAGAWPGSGIAEAVAGLARALQAQGHDVAVATLDGPLAGAVEEARSQGVRVVRFKPGRPHFLFYSPAMRRGLAALVRDADAVHVHGCWTFPVWCGAWLALRHKKTLVMSPHGSLDPVRLRHSAWKKRAVGWIDRWLLRRANVIHATCQAEAERIEKYLTGNRQPASGNGINDGGERRTSNAEHQISNGEGAEVKGYGMTSSPPTNELMNSCTNELLFDTSLLPRIVVVPNGVEVGDTRQSAIGNGQSARRTVLYLGRLHPLKGLDLLIDAWAEIKGGVRSEELGVAKAEDGERSSKVLKCESAKVGGDGAVGSRQSAVGSILTNELMNSRTNELLHVNSRTNELPRWRLLIIGPDEQGTLAKLIAQAERQGMAVSSKPLTVNGESLTVSGKPLTVNSKPLAIKEERFTVYGLPFTTDADIVFIGPVYGEEKARLMATADLFVLPTRSENFGIVVAEALACGVPVICTKGAPWSELLGNSDSSLVHECVSALVKEEGRSALVHECGGEQKIGNRQSAVSNIVTNELMNSRTNELTRTGRAGWWTDIGVEPLAEALREAMSLTDEERRALGANGRRLVETKYRWETVAQAMSGVYGGIVNRIAVSREP